MEHNETHAWEQRISNGEERFAGNIYPKSVLYPPIKRPFAGLVLQAPRRSEDFLNMRFGKNWREKCVIANYDHRLERVLDSEIGDGDELIFYPCAAIPNLPLVHRMNTSDEYPDGGGFLVEQLLVNGIEVQRVLFDRITGEMITES